MSLEQLGKTLLLFAALLAVAGLVMYFLGKGLGIPRLPGDIFYRRGNFTFYFPVVTAIVVSVILTVLLNIILWMIRR